MLMHLGGGKTGPCGEQQHQEEPIKHQQTAHVHPTVASNVSEFSQQTLDFLLMNRKNRMMERES